MSQLTWSRQKYRFFGQNRHIRGDLDEYNYRLFFWKREFRHKIYIPSRNTRARIVTVLSFRREIPAFAGMTNPHIAPIWRASFGKQAQRVLLRSKASAIQTSYRHLGFQPFALTYLQVRPFLELQLRPCTTSPFLGASAEYPFLA